MFQHKTVLFSLDVYKRQLSTLTVNDFYRNLATELGAQPAFRKTDNFKIIQDEINRLVLAKRQTPVIIIDEANYIDVYKRQIFSSTLSSGAKLNSW